MISCRSNQFVDARANSLRFKKYCLICILIPIMINIAFMYLFINNDTVTISNQIYNYKKWAWLQRTWPTTVLHSLTKKYMRSVGALECVIKSISFLLFVKSAFFIWQHSREMKTLHIQIHARNFTYSERLTLTTKFLKC